MRGLLQNILKASFPPLLSFPRKPCLPAGRRESRNHKARQKKPLNSLVKPENDNPEAFHNRPTRKGFTLLELIITLSLSSIIIIAALFVFSTFFRAYKLEAKTAATIQINRIVTDNIIKDCRNALNMKLEGQKAVFTLKDYAVSYELINNKVKRIKAGSTAYLTDDNEIKLLNFILIKPRLLKIATESGEAEVYCRNGK